MPETVVHKWKEQRFWLVAVAAVIGLSGPFAAGWAFSFVALEDPNDPIPASPGVQGALLLTVPAAIWWLVIGWSYLGSPVPTTAKHLWIALPRLGRFLVILAAVVFLGPWALVVALLGWAPFLLSTWPWIVILPVREIWRLADRPDDCSPAGRRS